MRVSLVLATFGRTDDLTRLFNSLAHQTLAPHEVLVMDQNPDERLLPFVSRAQATGLRVRHMRLDKANLSAARNRGIQAVTGDIVGFPDDDCWYEPQVVQQVANALATQTTWAGVVAQWIEQAATRPVPFEKEALSNEAWRRFRGGDASSISLFLRVGPLRQLGGFDRRLGVGQWFGAAEETDLLLSLLSSGHELWQLPEAQVHHRFEPTASGASLPWRAGLARARGTGALYVKHRLAGIVVARGLVAPTAKALWPWRGLQKLHYGLVTSLGRAQGMARWAWQSPKDAR